MKSSFIISFSDSLVTVRSLNASRFSTNVSIPRTFPEKRGDNCPPCPPLATLLTEHRANRRSRAGQVADVACQYDGEETKTRVLSAFSEAKRALLGSPCP